MERLHVEPVPSLDQWSLLPDDLALAYDALQEHFLRHFTEDVGWDSDDNMRQSQRDRQNLRDEMVRRLRGSCEILLSPADWPDTSTEIVHLRFGPDWGNSYSLNGPCGVFEPSDGQLPAALLERLSNWTTAALAKAEAGEDDQQLNKQRNELLSVVRWHLAGDYWVDDDLGSPRE